jgi:prespore-specific regulator
MKAVNSATWKEEENKLLVETILDYVRHGKTQEQAFEDVGEQLDRSKGACAFRWNVILRQHYVEELKFARRVRRGYKSVEKV